MLALLLKGILIGIAIAAPVGPIGVLCIQRSLHNGFRIGFFTGLGAAFADGTYGLIAGFGLTSISSLLIEHQFWIKTLGAAFLAYLAIKILLTPPASQAATTKPDKSTLHALTTTYFLTLANPMTILSFIAIFAGLGLGTTSISYTDAITLVLGITLGSAAWWLTLSGLVAGFLHHRVTPQTMRTINWLSAAIMIGFAIFAVI